ncbi:MULTISPECIES: 50S ribosomal protein L11 methyltransferase [Paenibacillus]|uniref:Ribosomal protein L11 methyltransferase n=1 Tax=Paenibacillus campinasensis TaxID=66347 RepID=A0A268F4L6_9BACL|nr:MULTISPECIES: 50S ribosomal protein L11 methyltransferase [Paenibacillus]MUG64584.1 50S ribosomal protein L11 methyltransferase [Paenibacillus campinasensis]PAD80310.1 50S ribosomal protein L11 methyltransferase [Paenibacillus campinasensis]PAK55293.1 50S ribosomal protein L11 methyltransferase [Paenibacillus sp. 7541]
MLWHELTIHTTEEAVEMITNFLHEAGAGGVSIEESGTVHKKRDTSLGQWFDEIVPFNNIPEGCAVIKGYFDETVSLESIVSEIAPRIEELSDFGINTGEVRYEMKTVNEEEWATAWKQYFKPIRVSERLTIKPTWETYEPESEAESIIELDPGMAFGTGTHPTTSLCLRTLESVIQGGEEVIDVGTGSGILSIGAAYLGASRILALDLDPVAVSSAKENTRLNGLEDRITIVESDLLSVLTDREHKAELGVTLPVQIVVANILAEVILLFVDDVYQALQPGGIYIASGIYKNKEEMVDQALKASGFEIADIRREDDWVAFVARKSE